MGKIVTDLTKLLLSKPTMLEYAKFNQEQQSFINEVIKSYVKPNALLRTRRSFFKRNVVGPKQNSFWNLSWEDVIMIKKHMVNENLFEVMQIVYGISEVEFMRLEVLNVFSCYTWITEQMKMLHAAEEERLHSQLTNDEINAGAEDLYDFEYYTALRSLCPDLIKQNDYMKLKYSVIFRELACAKVVNDINRKIQENAARKN